MITSENALYWHLICIWWIIQD